MALQSQSPRTGVNRRYAATTRRRKKGLAPWLVLLGVAVIVVGLYIIFGGDDTPVPATADSDTQRSSDAPPANPAANANAPAAAAPNTGIARVTNPRPVAPPPSDADSTRIDAPAAAASTPTRPTDSSFRSDPRSTLRGETKDQYENGMQLLEAGDVAAGRAILSELLFRDGALPRHEAQAVRERLANVAERTVFSATNRSAEQIQKDPVMDLYKVQSGDNLTRIGNVYRIPYQLIERINGIQANRLQAGQSIQVIRGPIHARVDKSDYRMDLFVYDPDGLQIYLKSYIVGLGEFDSTPMGMWRIKPGSKVGPANGGPSWRNPRTGKVYDRNDPDIPIGEYWMALEGTDENTKGKAGYGIHATNDPASIGRQESMGCIRMHDKDVDEVFYTLFEGASTVEIVP